MTAAYVLGAVLLASQALRITSWVWMVDEMLYTKAAVGFGSGAFVLPEVHGVGYGPPNGLYPLLLSPAYALLSATQAFKAAHLFNAAAFASVLLPVYLLARRLGVRWPWALFAGVLSVCVPWSVATLVVMTESVAYPAFMWAILAITVAIAQPRPRHDMLALLAIGVAVYARTQLIVLVAVLLLGIAAQQLAVREREWRRRLRPHLPLAVALIACAVLVMAVQRAGVDILGGYARTVSLPWFPPNVWGNASVHLAHLLVGVGVLPAVLWLTWLARVVVSSVGPLERAYAAVSAVAFVAVVYQTAFFSMNVAGAALQERYAFYVVPLMAVGMAALLSDDRRLAPRVSAVAAAVVVALAVGGATYDLREAPSAFSRVASGGAAFNDVLSTWVGTITDALLGAPKPTTDVLVVAAVILGVATVVVLGSRHRRVLAPLLAGLVLLFCAIETRWVLTNQVGAINTAVLSGMPGVLGVPRDWVDRTVPDGQEAALVVGALGVPSEPNTWLWTEFWNDDVTRAYQLGERPNWSGFPTIPLRLDARTGRLTAKEQLPYLVVSLGDPTLRIRGQVMRPSTYGAGVVRAERPYRASFAVTGGDYDGFSRGRAPQVVSLYPEAGPARKTRVRLTLEAPPGPRMPFEVRGGETRRGLLPKAGRRQLTVTARPDDAGTRSTVRVAAGATAKMPDGRTVGLRIAAVEPL